LQEFERIIVAPPRRYDEFPSNDWLFKLKARARDRLGLSPGMSVARSGKR
jgi:hypothetical protein